MKTNWKALVDKTNAELYAIPDGWTPREDMGKLLDCSAEKVSETLRAGLQLGRVEQKQFAVWNPSLGRKVPVICYRELKPEESEKKSEDGWDVVLPKVKILKTQGKSWNEISVLVGKSPEAVRKRWAKNRG